MGKSTLVRELARVLDMPLVEINLERNPELGQAFASNEPPRILSTLALMTGEAITPGESLLFLDEIQATPSALASLRYFYEEMPDLHVVAAGSLMELALGEEGFSMPVGRVEYCHLGPMVFEDFLAALGQPQLAEHLKAFTLAHEPIPGVLSGSTGLSADSPRRSRPTCRPANTNPATTHRLRASSKTSSRPIATTSTSTATAACARGCSWCSIGCPPWSVESSSTSG
ncbi:MAG: AAA family ATPase [Pseudomonadales bacterium]|nr:AAA family ATPase [Pseudomonadales bacterium]